MAEKSETKVEATAQVDLDNVVHVTASPEEEKKVLRKVDAIILPLMLLAYMLQFMDKVTIGNATVLGLLDDTGLHGSQYSWVSSIFYFGYLFWCYPASYLMVRFPLGKFLACTVAIWGAILMCHAACKNFAGLMVARFLLGAAEAALTPGFGLIVGMFYTKQEQVIRQNVWSSGFCIGNLFSGLCAFGVGRISGNHLAHWRILFLIFGAVTTAYAIPLFLLLPDSPAKAPFLNTRQRQVAVHRTISNKTGVMDESNYSKSQVLEALADPQSWLLCCFMLCVCIPNGALTSFVSLIVSGFGFSRLESLVLQMPTGVLQIILMVAAGVLSYFVKNCRLAIMTSASVIALLGTCLIMAIDPSQRVGRLVGVYFTGALAVNYPLFVSVVASNVAGFTKKSTVSAMLFMAYSVGNIIGPQFFLSSEAPRYETGLRAMVAGMSLATCFSLLLYVYYIYENRRRDRITAASTTSEHSIVDEEFSNLTDRKNIHFRYLL